MTERRGRMPHPATISLLLRSIFEGTPAGRVLKEGKIWLVWEDAVGRDIAARARPVRFAAGVLTIAVTTPSWLHQLNFLKKNIIDKINAALGEPLVTEIFLKAGAPRTSRKAPPPPSPPEKELTTEELEEIHRQVSGVPDPDLRASFAALLARARYRKR